MPNTIIIEGEVGKKFNPVTKIKVNNSDTGESTWIPEDSKTTHSLSVIKNGVYYAASEGYTAYDTVTVNVSSETEVNYEGIIADMPDLADLGLYDLEDLEGLDGLDLDLEELQDLENLLLDGDLEEGELPESGATIKGIDPDTGETLEVGLDEDGNLMEQALPDHIHIVVWPRKRHYLEGEIIDFSGIHVYLMNAGTSRFTCEQYPTGEIPFGELIFPVTVAGTGYDEITQGDYRYIGPLAVVPSAAEGVKQAVSIDDVSVLIENPAYDYFHTPMGNYNVYNSDGTLLNQFVGIVVNASVKFYYRIPINKGEFDYDYSIVCWKDGEHEVGVYVYSLKDYDSGSGDLPSGKNGVPVQWMRSDGAILEDTFEIEIGEGEDPEPEPDPYAGAYDFIWEGKAYCFNKSLARSEVMYSNGTVWQTWLGGQSPPYTVDQALKLKLIVQVGWYGGGSTSGGF